MQSYQVSGRLLYTNTAETLVDVMAEYILVSKLERQYAAFVKMVCHQFWRRGNSAEACVQNADADLSSEWTAAGCEHGTLVSFLSFWQTYCMSRAQSLSLCFSASEVERGGKATAQC